LTLPPLGLPAQGAHFWYRVALNGKDHSVTTRYPTDPINMAVTRLRLLNKDSELGHATGFFFNVRKNGASAHYLVTNWHVLSGRSTVPPYRALHRKGVPDRIVASLLLKTSPRGHEGALVFQEVFIPLYRGSSPLWRQHALGPGIDIGVIDLGDLTAPYQVCGITDHANTHDMAVQIAADVCILGYPHGFAHFLQNPIWKSGTIASEPHQEERGEPPRFMIDATTRTGMSGSPVILRAKTHYLAESGRVIEKPGAMRFIGVYAGRPSRTADAGETTEIGFVYKSGALAEIIQKGVPGLRAGEVPKAVKATSKKRF
jgi:hypothetical protein